MAITIQGIKITSVHINTDKSEDKEGVTSEYVLVSSEGKVLAKQAVGGYQGMQVQPAADTIGALNVFLGLYKRDVNTVLGLPTD